MQARPRFLQAIREFKGSGLDEYLPFEPPITYTVPDGAHAQCVYFRGGNSSDDVVCVVLTRDGEPMRLFPIGAHGAIHVPLRITEDLLTETRLEVHVAAPEGARGTVVLDFGLLEL